MCAVTSNRSPMPAFGGFRDHFRRQPWAAREHRSHEQDGLPLTYADRLALERLDADRDLDHGDWTRNNPTCPFADMNGSGRGSANTSA